MKAANPPVGGLWSASGHDAPVFSGEICVSGDRSRRRGVHILLYRAIHWTSGTFKLCEADVTEFWFAQSQIAQAECNARGGGHLCREALEPATAPRKP